MEKIKIGIIGLGNMGEAILTGILSSSLPYQLFVYDLHADKMKKYKSNPSIIIASSLSSLIQECMIFILAVKPNDVQSILEKEKNEFQQKILISIAVGLSQEYYAKILGAQAKVIRVMPNTPALVGHGFNLVHWNQNFSGSEKEICMPLLKSFGEVLEVEENKIDSGSTISGSGPGYIFYIMECFLQAALKFGFTKEEAVKIVKFTFLGSATLAMNSELEFAKLCQNVCSPKGTTIEAIQYFEESSLPQIIETATKKAYERAREITNSKL